MLGDAGTLVLYYHFKFTKRKNLDYLIILGMHLLIGNWEWRMELEIQSCNHTGSYNPWCRFEISPLIQN